MTSLGGEHGALPRSAGPFSSRGDRRQPGHHPGKGRCGGPAALPPAAGGENLAMSTVPSTGQRHRTIRRGAAGALSLAAVGMLAACVPAGYAPP